MHRRHVTVLLAATAGLVAAAAGPVGPASAQREYRCAKKPGEIKRTGGGVIWSTKGVVWGCTAFYGEPPETYRLGPRSAKSRFVFDGGTVAWTMPRTDSAGRRVDGVRIADVATGQRWLTTPRPTVGPGSHRDVTIARLLVRGSAAAWVTTQGTVIAALRSDEGGPEPVGLTPPPTTPTPTAPGSTTPTTPTTPAPATPAPVPPSPTTGAPQGLLPPFVADDGLYVVGRWEAQRGKALEATLKIDLERGESDDCGGSNRYSVTVRPDPSGPRLGLSEWVGFITPSAACNL